MGKVFSTLLCALTILGTYGHGVVSENLDTHRLIKSQFSSISQNRILVEGDRIKKVIFPDAGLSVKLEEESGQVFVYALTDYPRTSTLSIVTENGTVQDVELSFSQISSEILVLRCPLEKKTVQQLNSIAKCGEESIVCTVKSFLKGEVPFGYVSCSLPPPNRKYLKQFLDLELAGKFFGEKETLYLWKVRNHGRYSLKISECEVNFQGGDWVFLEKGYLSSMESTFFIVGMIHG